jgi:hypothetical protein
MEPKAATSSTSVPNKFHNQPTMSLVVEETQEASSSAKRFPRDYILPRNSLAEHVHLYKEVIYPLVDPLIPEGIIIEGDMLGLIPTLKYVDHDITDEKKFPSSYLTSC